MRVHGVSSFSQGGATTVVDMLASLTYPPNCTNMLTWASHIRLFRASVLDCLHILAC